MENNDMQLKRAMSLSLLFGLTGAAVIPFIYEIYANVSSAIALFLLAAGVVFSGIKFSVLSFKEAFIGITCTIAYSGIFGGVFFIFIHPKIRDMLIKRSVYFQLEPKQQLYFVLYVFLILLCMYLIWVLRFAVRKTVKKLNDNSEKAGEYIDNAFNDEEDKDN